MPGKKRRDLTNAEKMKIIEAVEKNKNKPALHKQKLMDIAVQFGVKPGCLSNIMKARENIISRSFSSEFSKSSKRFRAPDKFLDVDSALLKWFTSCRDSNISLSDDLLVAKSRSFADKLGFEGTISHSWIQRWKCRHDISSKAIHGESASVTDAMIGDWHKTILSTILEKYSPENIFNCDETGLFWKLTPQRTLAFKGTTCHDGKNSKERISVLVGASMVGEKLPLLVIGKSANPRVFRNEHVPINYTSNVKAWMTSTIFEDYIRKLDRKMQSQKRNIAMILDNCPCHPKMVDLRSITLIFLPPNTTSKTQPMDCGIIHSLKCGYRNELMKNLLISHDSSIPFKPNLLECLHWLHKSWHSIVTVQTIVNCFQSAGFVSVPLSIENSLTINDKSLEINTVQFDNIFDYIRQAFDIPENISLHDYNNSDSMVLAREVVTEEEIVKCIQSQTNETINDEEDEKEVQMVAPSPAEALNMLQKIRMTFLVHSKSASDFEHLEQLDASLTNIAMSSMKQTTLDKYFHSNDL